MLTCQCLHYQRKHIVNPNISASISDKIRNTYFSEVLNRGTIFRRTKK